MQGNDPKQSTLGDRAKSPNTLNVEEKGRNPRNGEVPGRQDLEELDPHTLGRLSLRFLEEWVEEEGDRGGGMGRGGNGGSPGTPTRELGKKGPKGYAGLIFFFFF